MCGDSDLPEDRSLLTEGQKTLDAQSKLAQQQFDLYKTWAPQYAQVGAQNYATATNALYPAVANSVNQANSIYQTALMGGIAQNGAQTANAIRGINPEQSALMANLTEQAQTELSQNGQLSARDKYNAAQTARSAGGARGNIMGNSTIFNEFLNNENLQRERQNNARNFASGVANMQNSFYTTPSLQVATASSSAPGLSASAAQNSAYGINADTYNPFANMYAMDLFNRTKHTYHAICTKMVSRDMNL